MYTRSHIGFDDPHHSYARYPFYPGYAAVGTVEQIGPGVQGFSAGDTIFYAGSHQSHALVATETALAAGIPSGVDPRIVPFARFGQITYTALHVSTARPGATVAVIGLGMIGNIAAQLFSHEGASVIGVEPVRFRREMATGSGIEELVDPSIRPTADAVRELTDGQGADIVVEATGDPALVTTALDAARPGGEVVLLGSPRGVATIDVYGLVHRKGVTMKGAHESLLSRPGTSGVEAGRDQIANRMLDLLREEKLKAGHLVSRVVVPEDARQAYEALLEEKDKVVGILIDWGEKVSRAHPQGVL